MAPAPTASPPDPSGPPAPLASQSASHGPPAATSPRRTRSPPPHRRRRPAVQHERLRMGKKPSGALASNRTETGSSFTRRPRRRRWFFRARARHDRHLRIWRASVPDAKLFKFFELKLQADFAARLQIWTPTATGIHRYPSSAWAKASPRRIRTAEVAGGHHVRRARLP